MIILVNCERRAAAIRPLISGALIVRSTPTSSNSAPQLKRIAKSNVHHYVCVRRRRLSTDNKKLPTNSTALSPSPLCANIFCIRMRGRGYNEEKHLLYVSRQLLRRRRQSGALDLHDYLAKRFCNTHITQSYLIYSRIQCSMYMFQLANTHSCDECAAIVMSVCVYVRVFFSHTFTTTTSTTSWANVTN